MHTRLVLVGLLVLAAGCGAADARAAAQATEAPDFLHALAGDWSVEAEAVLGPGQDPVRTTSQEGARMIGGRWLVAESKGTAGGEPVISILTLGYNAFAERFVGTWISGQQAHLWSYSGVLDPSGKVLRLDTEGPIHGDPTRTTRYREVIQIEGPDRKVVRSMILGPHGAWFEFQRAVYRRVDRTERDEEVRP